ncbi:MAG: DUF1385 domain-containing protein [Fimbriimonadales bacterium]
MQAEGLTRPDDRIIDLVRPTAPIYQESSLGAAIDLFRQSGADLIPVVDGSILLGVLWAAEVRTALLESAPLSDSIAAYVDVSPPSLYSSSSREEARSVLSASGRPALVVLDPDGRYLGIVRVLDLHHYPERLPRPPMVGGMATPLGVYLTNGSLSGGVKAPALVLTGAAMTLMLVVGVVITAWIYDALPQGTPSWVVTALINLLPVALFFLQVRLSPIAATHGAEHMVVHALERGEELKPEIVKRMPRVHPRCGTNLAIGALLFNGLMQLMWSSLYEMGALLALIITIVLWRPIGNFAQKYVTTRTPRDKDVASAIFAAEELLAKFRSSERRVPTIGSRLMASGLPLILIGSTVVMLLSSWIFGLLGLSERALELL